MTLDNIPITTITSLYNAVEYVVQREDKSGLPATTDFANKMRVTKTVGYLNVNNGEQLWTAQ